MWSVILYHIEWNEIRWLNEYKPDFVPTYYSLSLSLSLSLSPTHTLYLSLSLLCEVKCCIILNGMKFYYYINIGLTLSLSLIFSLLHTFFSPSLSLSRTLFCFFLYLTPPLFYSLSFLLNSTLQTKVMNFKMKNWNKK